MESLKFKVNIVHQQVETNMRNHYIKHDTKWHQKILMGNYTKIKHLTKNFRKTTWKITGFISCDSEKKRVC